MVYCVFIPQVLVSIRAPREGGDHVPEPRRSDPPVSIRAPREGGDSVLMSPTRNMGCFNPRPP